MSEQTTRVIALRHGETAWNVASRIQGQLDIGLNEVGRDQAARVAAALAGEVFDAIYSSDLSRARATAEAVARVAGLEVQTEPSLRERGFGNFEGLTFAEIQTRFPEEARRWRRRDAGFGPDGGETLVGFAERAVAGVAALAAKHRGQHIVVVTHGGVLDVLYRAASRVALEVRRTWQIGNASINRLLVSDDGFVLIGWGDVSHLQDAVLDEQGGRR